MQVSAIPDFAMPLGYDPGIDALVWQRLRSAGAGLLGKTSTHEFAYGTASHPTRNPWDLTRTPGGSSGGSAAALAARSVPVAFGTDTCGSLRIPAAACGVSTLRSAFGRVPTDGVLPLAPSFDVAGPMARRMADVGLLMSVVAGSPVPVARTQLAGVRIGLPTALLWDPVDDDMAAVCRDAVGVLASLGAELVEVPSPQGWAQMLDDEPSVPDLITEAEALEVHQQWLDQRDLYTPQVLRRVLTGEGISAVTYLQACRARREWTHAWRRLVDELQLDAVAHPTLSASTPTVDPGQPPLGPRIRSSLPWSITGWPALNVPVGQDRRGLPVGLSLAAIPERETDLVGLGITLDDILGCWRAAPAH